MRNKLLCLLLLAGLHINAPKAQQLIAQVTELQPGFNYKKNYFQNCPSCAGQCTSQYGGIFSLQPYHDKLYISLNPFANAGGDGKAAIARYSVSNSKYQLLHHILEDIAPKLVQQNSHIIFSSPDYQVRDSLPFYRLNVKTEALEMIPDRFLNTPHSGIATADDNAIVVPYYLGRQTNVAVTRLDHSSDLGNTFTTVLADSNMNVLTCTCNSTVQPDTVNMYSPVRFNGGYYSPLGQFIRHQSNTDIPARRCSFYFKGANFTAFNNNFPLQSSWKNIAALNYANVTFAGISGDRLHLFGMQNGQLTKLYRVRDSINVDSVLLPCAAKGIAGVTDAQGYYYFVSEGMLLYRTIDFQQWEQFLDLGEYAAEILTMIYWPQQNAILFTEKDGRWSIFRINLSNKANAFKESFESEGSAWTTYGTKDFLARTGPSRNRLSNTGPNAAAAGNFYMYVNSKAGSNNPSAGEQELSTVKDTAYLLSPALDMTAVGINKTLSFKYHMYGGTVGSLKVQVSTNGGNSFQTIWTMSGNQGDLWKPGSVDLSAYSGNSNVRIRFVAEVFANTSSDIALDDIRLGDTAFGGSELMVKQ
jgi:hypothetical protein